METDIRQAERVRFYLSSEGHRVTVAHDTASALRSAEQTPPDLMVLDVQLPRADGVTAARVLRELSSVPTLMLTDEGREDDLLLGFELGADDYLTKPYVVPDLAARLRVLLRRARSDRPGYRVGPLTVDPEQHLVTLDGRKIDCTPGEFAILTAMARHPGQVFSRVQLLEFADGLNRASTGRTIDVHVMNLRRKIESDPGRPRLLRTVYGSGYRLGASRESFSHGESGSPP